MKQLLTRSQKPGMANASFPLVLAVIVTLITSSVALLTTSNEHMFVRKSDGGRIWAVIVAGSKEYYNYRHQVRHGALSNHRSRSQGISGKVRPSAFPQADACHAYQILHSHGIPDERIIVMMYDDIADNEMNPTPGTIINHPDGEDVYRGVKKDYTGEDVTPDTFISVLAGHKHAVEGRGSGAVLESSANDHVFVYFADHGAPGLVAFPAGEDPFLHAGDLTSVLHEMARQKRFSKLVFYMEACESGSMFANLSANINVFAMTAANSMESSYACYYDSDRQTYLGDTFSVSWMEDTDEENISSETINRQYSIAKAKTTLSHVQRFGDLRLGGLTVSEFQGRRQRQELISYSRLPTDQVPSHDVPLEILRRKLESAPSKASRLAIRREIGTLLRKRKALNNLVDTMLKNLTLDESIYLRMITEVSDVGDDGCYKEVTRAFHQCVKFNENNYALRQLFKFANACKVSSDHELIITQIELRCPNPRWTGIH
ncbi:unnamed protein product [Notodromas monacha]|uniref:legumain n=1 Tax=Notodromas monacha TaxID=399045 RepID=A0A7R9BFE8_9CRUS|nr:unnamed protein product [Notodromas monacha]CAG0912837.1 unnamed protein product [Notodromas monacha]